ncbi:hypothetical protein BOX15_Mlig009714g4, partial [Macrostomum lignano]
FPFTQMASTLDSIRPPPILPPLRGIYAGKYKDRNPDLKTAGIVSDVGGDTAATATKEMERAESPEPTKKFHRTFRSEPGERIVFYGKASDPQLRWAERMTHGIKYPKGEGAGGVLNPTPLTFYQQRFMDRLEAAQVNAKKRPLGRCPDGREMGLLPQNLDKDNTTFGITVEKIGSAGELLNPSATPIELATEAASDANTYLVSHKALLAGEQASRGYNWRLKDAGGAKRWGKPTPHDNTGGGTRKCMSWIGDEAAARREALVDKRLDDFRERTQPQLGKNLDPIKDTMKVPPDHTFGVLHKPDPYGVGDLLHGRAPKHFLRGEDRRRALVAALRTQLKTMNYERFKDLEDAFRFYDKSGSGKLSADDIRAACREMSVPLDDSLLEQLIDFCDVNGDGLIDYQEFANFLNWRDISVRSQSDYGKRTLDSEARLARQIDESISAHKTTNSMYSAAVGRYDPTRFRTYGCATIRSDLPAPAVRSVSDRRAYGNEGDAASCLNPSIFTSHGVFEHDLKAPRSAEEISGIFSAAGISLDDSLVRRAFDLAGADRLGIDEFRKVWARAAAEDAASNTEGCC